MNIDIAWFQDHLLALMAIVFTLVLIYHYLIEKDTGVKLSKRYRNSIYEAQSKLFLNATQYLISGNKDLAIREFLNAVDLNRETIETYFALGGLFRSNGEIDKAISIHRSLIARENLSEVLRLRSLKELAVDFDKGGFVDKAIDTYKDVLKINRDQEDVIRALCRIYEDIGDWDQAYNYRMMLSKVGPENQAETISHVLVEKAKEHFENGEYKKSHEDLGDAFRFAPSVSAKILKLKLNLVQGDIGHCKLLLLELLKEHPVYASFIFVSLVQGPSGQVNLPEEYFARLAMLKDYFLEMADAELDSSPSVVLAKVRLLKDEDKLEQAYQVLRPWVEKEGANVSQVMKTEYIRLLSQLGKKDEAIDHLQGLLDSIHGSLARHYCKQCGYNSDDIFWRCPQCHEWETIQFRWKV